MTTSLENIAAEIRKAVVRMHWRGTCVGSSMSIVDLLAALYFDIMRIDNPDDPQRDRFILSKGHAASALYATLALKGFFPTERLAEYYGDNSVLTVHPSRGALPGIEVSTGSLGHGLPIAIGLALAARADGNPCRFFVLMGDGELQEGSVWEGAAIAARFRLDNITAIIDANNLQGYGRVADIQPIETFRAKWEAFGWSAKEIDGHCVETITKTLRGVPFASGQPSVLIAHTTKGKGVSEMEDQLGWHYFSVPREKIEPFIEEIERGKQKNSAPQASSCD